MFASVFDKCVLLSFRSVPRIAHASDGAPWVRAADSRQETTPLNRRSSEASSLGWRALSRIPRVAYQCSAGACESRPGALRQNQGSVHFQHCEPARLVVRSDGARHALSQRRPQRWRSRRCVESCSELALRVLERAQTVQTERARLLRLTPCCC